MLFIHPEIVAAMNNKSVYLFEAVGIEKDLESFAGGEFSLLMLGFDPSLPASQESSVAFYTQFTQKICLSHGILPAITACRPAIMAKLSLLVKISYCSESCGFA
jgi:hypothetical protein